MGSQDFEIVKELFQIQKVPLIPFFVVHFILVELQHMNTMHIPLGRMSSSVVWLVSCFYTKRLELARDLIKI